MPSRILVVGAGCTGAAAALRLRHRLGAAASIKVWEKARGAGGRYTTSRDSYPDGLKADMGAQYASVDPNDADSMAVMKDIVEAGASELVHPESLCESAERPASFQHYRGTAGQNGIVKAMLNAAKADVVFERRVSKLDAKGPSWRATAYDGAAEDFDCIVMCVPGLGPGGDNLNKIHGNWERLINQAYWPNLEVPHDCRYSVALWLEKGHQKALSGFFGNALEKKVNSDAVELLYWQSRKDGEAPDGPQVIVVHTAQGAKGNKQQAEPRMIADACRLVGIPKNAITSKKIITWFQSQVQDSGKDSRSCLVAVQQPPLVLAGDYLTASTFTGSVTSAFAAVSEVESLLGGEKPKGAEQTSKGEDQQRSRKSAQNSGGYQSNAGNASNGNSRCSECGKQAKCFKDDSDGKMYCTPCWKAYYGKAPVAGG